MNITKRAAMSIFGLVAWIMSLIYFPGVVRIWRRIWAMTASMAISRRLQRCGEDFRIDTPNFVCGFRQIQVGRGFRAFAGLRMEAIEQHNGIAFAPKLEIGDNVSLNFNCHIGCSNHIIIGDNVLIASNVFITDHSHGNVRESGPDWRDRPLYSKGPVVIEHNVWLGECVCVLPGVRIGHGSVIGANSVVSHDIPPMAIAAGNPAKVLRMLEYGPTKQALV